METARNGIFAPLNLLLSLMQPGGREANWELETPLRRRQPGQLMDKPQEPVFRTCSQPARKRADAHICLSASLACQARK